MTAATSRPDIPQLLPAKPAQQPLPQTLIAGLRDVDRPWSIAIDLLVLGAFVALMCWEVWEFGLDGEWEHLAAACVCLVAGVLHAFRSFTTDRPETDR